MNRLPGASIAFVNNFAGPGLGGGEVYLLNLIRGCIAAGMRADLVCERDGRLAEEARLLGVSVVPQHFGPARVQAVASAVRRHVRESEPSIVHSGGVMSDLVAARAVQGLPIPLVNTVHVEVGAASMDGASYAGVALRRLLQRYSWKHADRIIAVSHAVARSVERLGVETERVSVVHNGIDVSAVRGLARIETKLTTALPAAGLLVGCVARLEPVKGVADLVRAAGLLASERPDVSFVVVGGGSQEALLMSLARDLGVADRIVFTGSVVPSAGILSRCDVAVVPSLSEGLGLVALEAMALGIPVVATRVGGLPEVVEDGVTGRLVPPNDPRAIAGAVAPLLEDPQRRAAMGAAGLERVEREFSVDLMVARHLEIYRDVLSPGSAT